MQHQLEWEQISIVYSFEKGSLQSSKNTVGPYTFVTASGEFKTHIIFKYDIEALCFAFAASGSLGRTHYINGKFIASDLVYVMIPKLEFQKRVSLKYHYYYLNHYKEEIVRLTKSGTSKASINRNAFSSVKIPLPTFIEQQRIVSIIDVIKINLNKIKELRVEQTKDINNLLFSKYTEIIKDAVWLPKVLPVVSTTFFIS